MLIQSARSWEIRESRATPEHVFLDRRRLLGAGAAIGVVERQVGIEQRRERRLDRD